MHFDGAIDLHLEPRFGRMRLDEITTPVVARFRADLVANKLSDKRINNIRAVLSKPMKYAVDCEVIEGATDRMFKVRPEIVAWDFFATSCPNPRRGLLGTIASACKGRRWLGEVSQRSLRRSTRH